MSREGPEVFWEVPGVESAYEFWEGHGFSRAVKSHE
jgi:hypothetical protein